VQPGDGAFGHPAVRAQANAVVVRRRAKWGSTLSRRSRPRSGSES
jgi:hypothetical protein